MTAQQSDETADAVADRPETPRTGMQPRDPEEASRALVAVQDLLRLHKSIGDAGGRERGDPGSAEDSAPEQKSLDLPHMADLDERIRSMHPADVAFILEALPYEDRMLVWDLVESAQDGEILLEVSESVRESLIRSMDRDELVEAVETLDADEIAELAPDLPRDVVEQVRRGLSQQEREQLRASLSFPEGSVGELMDFEAITVPREFTLEMVLRELRRLEELPDHTDQVYVVDERGGLLGSLPLDRLLVNQPEVQVEDVMQRDVLTLQTLDDAGDAAQAFERYDLVSAPVVDPANRVIGRVTVAEVLDLIREEAESDMLAKAGLREEEDIYSSVWASARNRWMWLALNLCTAFFASRVIEAFEGTIERVVALATLMPIVAGIAGNTGNQTMTLIIRSIALGQVNMGNARRLLGKELAVAGLNGLVWGGVAGLVAWLLYRETSYGALLGFTMTLAMVLNLLVGALIALIVPLTLQRIGRDPALGSSVLLTFSTDSMGFLIFLGLATLLFR